MEMIRFIRTNSDNSDFQALVKCLDADLKIRDGDMHGFYDQFNKIDHLKYVVVAYENDLPISCGAIKEYSDEAMEVKRMFVQPHGRNRGMASAVLKTLEDWAIELSFERCVLETGMNQPEAIRLYEKNGYKRIANYGQYIGIENSICFEKRFKNE